MPITLWWSPDKYAKTPARWSFQLDNGEPNDGPHPWSRSPALPFDPKIRPRPPYGSAVSRHCLPYSGLLPNPPLPSLLILHPIPLCPPALPTHPLHRLHSSHPSCHTRSPPRQRSLRHVSSNSHTPFSVSPLSPCSLYWIPFRPTSSSLYRTYMYPFPPYASPTPPCSLSFPAACLRTSCVDSPCCLFSAYSFPTPFPPTTRPSLLVLSSLLVLHDRRPSPHTLTPFTAEVLTRVMRLGLESDSSHYFCDLWLDLDLQRKDLRLDLGLQRNDLLPMQVKSYSSDPGTS